MIGRIDNPVTSKVGKRPRTTDMLQLIIALEEWYTPKG